MNSNSSRYTDYFNVRLSAQRSGEGIRTKNALWESDLPPYIAGPCLRYPLIATQRNKWCEEMASHAVWHNNVNKHKSQAAAVWSIRNSILLTLVDYYRHTESIGHGRGGASFFA